MFFCSLLLSALTVTLPAAEIPPGTRLTVRMIDAIDSRSSTEGQLFRASLDEAVLNSEGQLGLARGVEFVVRLTTIGKGGKIAGRPAVKLELVALKQDEGQTDVAATPFELSGKNRSKKSAMIVGGATAAGAVIGGLATGGPGVALGALSGAGAGAGYRLFSKREVLRIPSETRVTFILTTAIPN